MALQPAGTRTHSFRIETATVSRNAVGEAIQSWSKLTRRRGSIKQTSYGETTERKQTVGQSTFEIVIPFVDGLDGTCRIVWESGGNRILYPTSVVADERDEQTIIASEKTA
jgi:hypothetical protein